MNWSRSDYDDDDHHEPEPWWYYALVVGALGALVLEVLLRAASGPSG